MCLVSHKSPDEEQQDPIYGIKLHESNTVYVIKTFKRLNLRLEKYKKCLNYVTKSSVNFKKLEDGSTFFRNRIKKSTLKGPKYFRKSLALTKED